VRGSAEGLAALYEQPMRWAAAKRGGLTNLSAGRWAQDDSPVCRHTLLSQLPAVRPLKPLVSMLFDWSACCRHWLCADEALTFQYVNAEAVRSARLCEAD